MTNLLRAFALSLVVTGAFASVHMSQASQVTAATVKVSACPPPLCPPSDPNACGIGDFGN